MSVLDTILSFYEGKGLSSDQAAALAGNFQVESGLDPAAANPNEGAIGLAQWEGGRRANLDAYAAATGGSETDLSTQLGYSWSELTGGESDALHRLLATNDPAAGAAVVDQYYERSSGAARGARVAAAQAIAAGTPLTAGTGAAGATASPAGFLGIPSMSDVQSLVYKAGAGLAALALVVIGIKETVRSTP